MPQRTIRTNDLTTRAKFFVRGKIAWSQITKVIEGEELARDQEARRRRGWPTIDKPYTRISLYNASVLYTNPNAPTLEERYAEESMFDSKSPNNPGKNYSVINKGTGLVRVGTLEPDRTVHLIMPEAELAIGLDVTLVMSVYDPGAGKNKGVGLELVILNEPPRYNLGRSIDLSSHGLTYVADPAIEAQYAARRSQALSDAAPEAPAPAQASYAAPAPAPVPAAAPAPAPAAYQPFSTGVQAPPQAAPAPSAQPVYPEPPAPAQAAPGVVPGYPGAVVPGYPGSAAQTPYDPNQDPSRMY